MKVKRIVANIDTQDIAAATCFYQDVLGLNLLICASTYIDKQDD